MSTIKISELATSAISLTDFFAKADASGLANKNTMQGLSNFLNTVGTLAYRGVLLAADAAVTLDGIYVAGDDGTYTNNGGLVITISNQIVLISITETQTVFEKVEIPVSIVKDAIPTEGSTNPVESGGVFSKTALKNSLIFNPLFRQRKNKYLAYNPSDKKLIVVGSDNVSPSDTQIFNFINNGITYYVNGGVGAEQLITISEGNDQIGILSNVADPTNVTLSDFVTYTSNSEPSNFIKLAHLTYNDGLTSNIIIDYRKVINNTLSKTNETNPVTGKAVNDFVGSFDRKIINRKNKYLAYDAESSKLKIVGSDDSSPSDEEVFSLIQNGIYYTFNGFVNTELSINSGTGNCQILILKSGANKVVTFSDILVFQDGIDRSETHINLARIIYNDGLSSDVVLDYRYFVYNLRSVINTLPVFYENGFRNRKRKWLSWDRESLKLKIVGNDTASPADEQIFSFYYNDIFYVVKGFAGTEQGLALVSGNSQIGFLDTVADPANVTLSDFVVYNDTTFRSNFIKLAHLTYNDGLTSNIIIDYKDYINSVTNDTTTSRVVSQASEVNNSTGETNFANGVQTNLKVLAFGNSFMRNSIHYLSEIASSGVGVNLTIGNLYTGGTQLSNHLSAMKNNTSPYVWNKYENGVNTETQTGQTAKRGLKDERWDAVILHQYTPWTYPMQPVLNEVMSEIVEILGYCPKFYINATWATHEDYVLSQNGFATETIMWDSMLNLSRTAGVEAGIIPFSIIPTGTAIQNARTLSFADDYNRFVNAGVDWHHLNSAGGFIAACTIYQSIVSPLNKVDCSDTTFRINTPEALPPGSQNDPGIVVTNANYLAMCNSAIDAVGFPNTITSQ